MSVRDALIALSAGDCLGATSEFCGPREVIAQYRRHVGAGWPFVPVGGGALGWRPGQGTDDTDCATALVRAQFDPERAATELVEWARAGPRDIGGTTQMALLREQCPWIDRGHRQYRRNPRCSSNGSLMRNGVVESAGGDLAEALRRTVKLAVITHYDPLSVLCCCAQTWLLRLGPSDGWVGEFLRGMAAFIVADRDPAIGTWTRRTREGQSEACEIFARGRFDPDAFNPFDAVLTTGHGHSLLTLEVAVWAMNHALRREPYDGPLPYGYPSEPFKRVGSDVLGWVAMIGADSDTYGATAGPLVAAACGGLPSYMTDELEII